MAKVLLFLYLQEPGLDSLANQTLHWQGLPGLSSLMGATKNLAFQNLNVKGGGRGWWYGQCLYFLSQDGFSMFFTIYNMVNLTNRLLTTGYLIVTS